MIKLKNNLYEEIRKYIKENKGFGSELKNTELYKKILKMQEDLKQFEGKKVKIVYHYSADYFGNNGVKIGKIVFEGDKIKFFEGLNRSKFFWLDLGLFEGFYATLILKEISEISKKEFKDYLKKRKEERDKKKWLG